jgi:hypothetical protein
MKVCWRQRAVLNAMAPGISWVQMHLAAEKEILRALIQVGVVQSKDGSVVPEEELLHEVCLVGLGAVFLPCG